MTPEEQRELAIECGAKEKQWWLEIPIHALTSYTAAVEAKERERCAKECMNIDLSVRALHPGSVKYGMNICADLIRSLK